MKFYNTEVASAIKEKNILELSERAKLNTLQADDKEAIEILDNFAKEVGKSGKTQENTFLVSELIKKTVEPVVFQPDDSILGTMFEMGTIGEFDEKKFTGLPKNTIKVYDAARGGNVPKSYVDPTVFDYKKVSLQAETELNYSDLRRNGFKSIAKMTELTREAFEQELFYRLFGAVDDAITGLGTAAGDRDVDTSSALTLESMDIFSRYLRDMSDGGAFMVGLSKYADQIKRLDGYETFLSNEMKNELNRIGYLSLFDGVPVSSVPTARKTAKGQNLIPDKRIFGIAGKIGEADMRGELRMYETYDHNAEKVSLKFTGYEFDYVIYHLDRIARIKFS